MATILQHAQANHTGVCAFGSNNTVGSTLYLMMVGTSASNDPTAAVADTQLNAGWVKIGYATTGSSTTVEFWACPNCKAGANTVTITSGITIQWVAIAEESGMPSTITQSGTAQADDLAATTTPTSTGFVSSATATIFALVGRNGANQSESAVSSPFTVLEQYGGDGAQAFAVATGQSAGTFTPQFTYSISSVFAMLVAGVEEGGGGGQVPPITRGFFGV